MQQSIAPAPRSSANSITALTKLRLLAHSMRALSAGYAAWVIYGILHWWLNGTKVLEDMGRYLGLELSQATDAQIGLGLALNCASWLVLLMAVVECWRFLGSLTGAGTDGRGDFRLSALHLLRCGWWALGAWVAGILLRPMNTLTLTWHLPDAQHVSLWNFTPVNLQELMFCLLIVMCAYLMAWTAELAEENRSFV